MLIYFDPRKQEPPRLGRQGFDGVVFVDGANDISEAEWAKIEGHPGVAAAIQRGALRIPPVVEALNAPMAEADEVVLLPPPERDPIDEAKSRLAELEAIYLNDGWKAIKAIAEPLGVEKDPDGWDASLMRIIEAEFGADIAAELEEAE